MSSTMDKALMVLSLEEEDEPFIMPNLPGFSSNEINKRSLIGRTLNPECQPMATLIRNMPRKWGKEGKVRGIVLSKEKFQFIFNNEHDLQDVLDRGVQTSNEWALAMERWVEQPPEDYLQFISLWVQISKIPINFYTEAAITSLAELLGFVEDLAFDSTNSQTRDFVRVKVRFDVSKPLRMSKVVHLPDGSATVIHFNYEQIQKRCFTCQRLIHEQSRCPLLKKKKHDEAMDLNKRLSEKAVKEPVLKDDDPLFGVLKESQVTKDPNTGRPKIAEEVLNEMRRYLLANNGEDKKIREERVKLSLLEAEKDPIAKRISLSLDPLPRVTKDLDKGKGIVFNYGIKPGEEELAKRKKASDRMLTKDMNSAGGLKWDPVDLNDPIASEGDGFPGKVGDEFPIGSTVFSSGFSEPCYSGTSRKKTSARKRPFKARRKASPNPAKPVTSIVLSEKQIGKQAVGIRKRKVVQQEEELVIMVTNKCLKAVPMEGLPNAQ